MHIANKDRTYPMGASLWELLESGLQPFIHWFNLLCADGRDRWSFCLGESVDADSSVLVLVTHEG